MQKHLGKYHGDLMEEVTNSQVAAKVANKKIDVRCESVRGVVPLFNLRSQDDRAAFIRKVKYEQGFLRFNFFSILVY